MIDNLSTELTFLKYRQNFFSDFIKKHTHIPKDCNLETELVQRGIYPRLLCSPSDALYCAYFIETIMKLQIPEFPVLELIKQCILLILPCVHCCTEGEASNIGFFFLELLKILSSWRYSLEHDGKNCPVLKEVSIKDFREYFENYHSMITTIITGGLASSYLVQKNCLNVINRISLEYPSTKETAKNILQWIAPIKDSEMEALKLIAQRVYDNIDRKFSEPVIPELPKKRSHEKSEEKKSNGDNTRNRRKQEDTQKSVRSERNSKHYISGKGGQRKDDHRHNSYNRRN